MSDRHERALDDLVSVEATVEVVVMHDGDDIIYSLHLSDIKRIDGELRAGFYKAIILALRQPIPPINVSTENQEPC